MKYEIIAEGGGITMYYHGKDKNGMPIFYAFKNWNASNKKVYPREFNNMKQADETLASIADYYSRHETFYKDIKFSVRTI